MTFGSVCTAVRTETDVRPRRYGVLAIAAMAAVLVSVSAFPSHAQLTPDRTYYGVSRPMPLTVAVPDGSAGDVEIHLLEPVTAAVAERAAVKAGRVDLAALFPVLWTSETPGVRYAQLVVGETKVGPAVVLQPMLTPEKAISRDAYGSNIAFQPRAAKTVYSGIRAYVDRHVVLETSLGDLEIALRPDSAPNTAWNFRHLAEGGFYTNIIFHRVVAIDGTGQPFVIQVGDPTGTGNGGPGYFTDLERSTLRHDFGVVSMARTPDPDTNGSQVFICLSRGGTARLDGGYVTFAEVVGGLETIQAISAVPVSPAESRPLDPPVIRSARLVDAPPYGDGPKPVAAPGSTPAPR